MSILVAISETGKLLLTGSVPDHESDFSSGGVELHGVDLYSEGGDVLFLEFTSQMSFYEGGFSDASVSD